ncbi:unnamed protein product [Strongylus vulgaris]|uniref:Major facilitator superfamily (MFS) profile domain-containing protein n=1 Tax=Strongylus vulgaris TaxID=40348 RepID=A0A3P7IYM9_STRVU|nr:unnamed protein product [Strongylus vulgaris]
MISVSTGLMLQVGLVVAAITAMPELSKAYRFNIIFGTVEKWWLVYGVEAALTLLVTIFMIPCPESPSFLMSKGKSEEAQKSIIYYHGISEDEAMTVLKAMQDTGGKGEKPTGLFGIFSDKEWRCGSLVGMGIMTGAILCGVAGK